MRFLDRRGSNWILPWPATAGPERPETSDEARHGGPLPGPYMLTDIVDAAAGEGVLVQYPFIHRPEVWAVDSTTTSWKQPIRASSVSSSATK